MLACARLQVHLGVPAGCEACQGGWSSCLLVLDCRYSKVADWAYIRACAQATAGALPLIGNGDVVSFEDFHGHLEAAPELTTIMLARGALVKPWIFTEVCKRLHSYLHGPQKT